MCSQPTQIVLSTSQMLALADPLRSDLVLALRAHGKGSVADLARRLEIDANTLYYPLKKLVAAGLVRAVGTQKGRRRTETVYALTAERFEISRHASLESRARLVRATIRAAERDFLAAQATCAGEDDLQIIRSQLWLSPGDRRAFLSRIDALAEEFGARSVVGEGELLQWTSLVSPTG